jgi:hypothetical protein
MVGRLARLRIAGSHRLLGGLSFGWEGDSGTLAAHFIAQEHQQQKEVWLCLMQLGCPLAKQQQQQ